MSNGKRRGSRDFNYAGLDGGEDGGDVPVDLEDVDPEDVCPQCSRPVSNWDPAIRCDSCEAWNHAKCQGMTVMEYETLMQSTGMEVLQSFFVVVNDLEDAVLQLRDLIQNYKK